MNFWINLDKHMEFTSVSWRLPAFSAAFRAKESAAWGCGSCAVGTAQLERPAD